MTELDPASVIPDYQSLMLPVLRAAEAGEARIGDVIQSIADSLSLGEASRRALLPSGRTTVLSDRTHWAKTYLTKAGLVEPTRRGHFRITQRGRDVLAARPAQINKDFLTQFDEFRTFIDRSTHRPAGKPAPATSEERDSTPDEIMRAAHQQIEVVLAGELLGRVRTAPPEFFERLIISLLLAMGYGGSSEDAGRVLGGSGDDGVDGVIDQDALGLDRVYIQAKRYAESNSVGPAAVRDFFGSLDRHKAAKGLFVTTSAFTGSARETAEYLSKRIVLVDGEQLARLMIRHNVGCRIEETLPLRKIDEDFFE